MTAQQLNLDTVANNLANVNTPGFKKTRIDFQDLLYDSLKPGATTTSSTGTTTTTTSTATGTATSPTAPVQVGHGVRISGTQRTVTAGTVESTGNNTDLAIDGQGYFRVLLADGTVGYTRDGSFRISGDSKLTTSDGYALCSSNSTTAITVPDGTTEIAIGTTGEVTFKTSSSGSTTGTSSSTTLNLAMFKNPAGLQASGKNLYLETTASGTASVVAPGASGAGTLLQGYIERSNVQVVEEMVNLIIVQRAYEMNTKAVTSSDDILSMTNNLIRR
jgi:flagellar basal-body rod protein FlgG